MIELPKIVVSEYDLTLPISKKTIRFRPFLVREEKILLSALEGMDSQSVEKQQNDTKELIRATIQVIKNCVLTPDINAEDLPVVDVEFLFLNIRKKSVGEQVEIVVKHDVQECGHVNKLTLDLNRTKPILPENHSNIIHLGANSGFKLRYPSLSQTLTSGLDARSEVDSLYKMIASSIESVFDGDAFSVVTPEDIPALEQWIETFDKTTILAVIKFFENQPYLQTKIEYDCEKCKQHVIEEVQGTASFFT